ncbi:NADP-dependent oxidoreductase [Paraburkholderia susongensis]|uniref:NADPH:quinone reductase n=1 Tax=Paraburkholderia susongensis TaxID=1515439 RepID=A0A1X7LYC2_9BURK|nr:NADP-dependent oxidoreductase [Paraburkholderia susongensis]SMG58908.1 NADPH:quinone reductase [Paraburkholderia susongensis]
MHAMRYHEFGSPECLQDDVVERPRPAQDEVLIELAAAGVNPADWQLGAGYARGFLELPMPFIPGMDFAGVVREVGSGVTGFAIGDRVFGAALIARCGTYAEYVAVPAAIVEHAPGNLPLYMAAAVPLAAQTAWAATIGATHGNVRAGQRVLIQGGAGGTGMFAIQFAKQRGAHVIATGSAGNHDWLRSLGANEVVDYSAVRFEDVVDPVDAVIDLVGGDVTARSIPLIRAGGVLASIVRPPDSVAECEAVARRHDVRLSFVDMSVDRDPAAFNEIARQLGSGALKVALSETYPLRQASQALAASRTGHVRGKIVLTIGSLNQAVGTI